MDGMTLNVIMASTAGLAGCWLGFFLRGGKKGNPARESDLEQQLGKAIAAEEQIQSEWDSFKAIIGERDSSIDDLQREIKRLEEDAKQARAETRSVQTAMDQLQQLAASMAANVDEHSNQMQAINDELGDGDESAQADCVVSVVARLIEANAKMQEQLDSAEEKLQTQQEELQTQMVEARTDALTGLANRRAFDSEMVNLELNYAATGNTSSVMMIDVDDFKKINDTYGHQAGDEVLRGVARVLSDQITENATVCRYGGEEFCVIFPNASVDQAASRAEQARAAIGASRFPFAGQELTVTASGGVANLVADETADELVKRADDALYVCKESGRDCGIIQDGVGMRPMTARLLEAAAEALALENSQLDQWTGLSTKETFVDDLSRRLAESKRGGDEMSLMILGIDQFNTVCTTESAERTVIKATSQFLNGSMREMDHVARYGEQQFAFLLPSTAVTTAAGVAERLRSAIDNCKLPAEGGILKFTVSLAIEAVRSDDDSASLLERTEATLQQLANAGGNRCNVATEETTVTVQATANATA
jgi:diguanylate cyclase